MKIHFALKIGMHASLFSICILIGWSAFKQQGSKWVTFIYKSEMCPSASYVKTVFIPASQLFSFSAHKLAGILNSITSWGLKPLFLLSCYLDVTVVPLKLKNDKSILHIWKNEVLWMFWYSVDFWIKKVEFKSLLFKITFCVMKHAWQSLSIKWENYLSQQAWQNL